MSEFDNNNDKKTPDTPRRLPTTGQILGLTFGIFMVIIYLGMGILLMINFFDWNNSWAWTRWIVGPILVIYGFYRGWRQYKMLNQTDND